MIELVESVLLPRVEDPVPETIGLNTIFTVAGAGGVLLLFASSALGLPAAQRDAWARKGVNLGFMLGTALYATALGIQLL